MGIITWQNVPIPDFRGQTEGIRTAAELLNRAVSSAGDAVGSIDQMQRDRQGFENRIANADLVNRMLAFNDPAQFSAARAAGAFSDPALLARATPETLKALDARLGTLQTRADEERNRQRTLEAQARMDAIQPYFEQAIGVAQKEHGLTGATKILSENGNLTPVEIAENLGRIKNLYESMDTVFDRKVKTTSWEDSQLLKKESDNALRAALGLMDIADPGEQRRYVENYPFTSDREKGLFYDKVGGLYPDIMGKALGPNATMGAQLPAATPTRTDQANYNQVFGEGKYGRPSKDPIEMTTEEFDAWAPEIQRATAADQIGLRDGKYVGTSAIGKYQITNETWNEIGKDLWGKTDSQWKKHVTLSPENQDRVAAEIRRRQGDTAWDVLNPSPDGTRLGYPGVIGAKLDTEKQFLPLVAILDGNAPPPNFAGEILDSVKAENAAKGALKTAAKVKLAAQGMEGQDLATVAAKVAADYGVSDKVGEVQEFLEQLKAKAQVVDPKISDAEVGGLFKNTIGEDRIWTWSDLQENLDVRNFKMDEYAATLGLAKTELDDYEKQALKNGKVKALLPEYTAAEQNFLEAKKRAYGSKSVAAGRELGRAAQRWQEASDALRDQLDPGSKKKSSAKSANVAMADLTPQGVLEKYGELGTKTSVSPAEFAEFRTTIAALDRQGGITAENKPAFDRLFQQVATAAGATSGDPAGGTPPAAPPSAPDLAAFRPQEQAAVEPFRLTGDPERYPTTTDGREALGWLKERWDSPSLSVGEWKRHPQNFDTDARRVAALLAGDPEGLAQLQALMRKYRRAG